MYRSPPAARKRSALVALVPCILSCVGSIGGDPSRSRDADEDAAEAALCAHHEPFMRRLTMREYQATIADLVGPDTVSALALPPDSFLDGFDNQAPTLGVSALHIEGYLESAGAIANTVRADDQARGSVFGCGDMAAPDDVCLSAFVERFGRLAYRRPLEQEDVEALFALAQTGADDPDPWRRATLMLEGILQSPHFLYRVEIGVEDPEDASLRRLFA